MRRVLVCLVLSSLVFSVVAKCADEPRREAVHRRAEEGLLGKEPEWKKELEKALEQKVSFEFVDTPLTEAIDYLRALAKINVVLDPMSLEEIGGELNVTLKVTDMPLGRALRWVLRLASLDCGLKDGALFIGTEERIADDVELRVYDLREFALPIADSPGPDLDVHGKVFQDVVQKVPFYNRYEWIPKVGEIAERIRDTVAPASWALELGTSIEDIDSKLVVMQRPRVHRQIACFLDAYLLANRTQVRVEARLLAVSERVLDQLKAYRKPGSETVFLWQAQLDYLDRMLEDGREAQQVASLHVTCRNGQRCHTLSGTTFEREDEEGREATFFRGTILDVRPKLGPARKYVTMDLRLTRVAGGEKPGKQGQAFRCCGTVTCLETDTVLFAGATSPEHGGKRLVALLTPHLLRLEPQTEEKPEAGVAAVEGRP